MPTMRHLFTKRRTATPACRDDFTKVYAFNVYDRRTGRFRVADERWTDYASFDRDTVRFRIAMHYACATEDVEIYA